MTKLCCIAPGKQNVSRDLIIVIYCVRLTRFQQPGETWLNGHTNQVA